jgi:hypothetical protein
MLLLLTKKVLLNRPSLTLLFFTAVLGTAAATALVARDYLVGGTPA